MFDDCGGVGRIMVHVVAGSHLGGATVTAPVMCNDAIALGNKEQHLGVPVVRGKRPTVVKHDRLAASPVFVKDLGAVLRLDDIHTQWSSFNVMRSIRGR